MDLVFTRTALLDENLDDDVLGPVFEQVWGEELRSPAKLRLEQLGITDRDAFVLNPDGTYDEHLSRAMQMLGGVVAGRTTMEGYARAVFRFARWVRRTGLSLDALNAESLVAYHRYKVRIRGISPRSWNAEAAAIKTFLRIAAKAKIIPANPLVDDDIGWFDKAGKVREEPKFITMKQFAKFRDEGLAFGRYAVRNVAFSNLLLSSGMRLDEGNDYETRWLPKPDTLATTETKTLRHLVRASAAKGGKARYVRISTKTFESMRRYEKLLRRDIVERAKNRGGIPEDPVRFWLNQSGRPMAENGWEYLFREASRRSRVEVTPHTLRHTFAVHLLGRMISMAIGSATRVREEADKTRLQVKAAGSAAVYNSFFGDPLRRLQKLLGHANYESTFVYIDLLASNDGFEDEALAVFEQFIDAEETYDGASENAA